MFYQSFGDSGETATEADTVSSVEFDRTGKYLATGDRGGRIVIFKHTDMSPSEKGDGGEWSVLHQFQSHEAEFDYLKSLEIEEKINQIKWCNAVGDNAFLLSTNDKTIKLWKIGRHPTRNSIISKSSIREGKLLFPSYHKNVDNTSQSSGEGGGQGGGGNYRANPRRIYSNAHTYHINSISLNSDGETFISADDLRINWWNHEISDRSFNIVDIKPVNMEELTEVITSATFHPSHCNVLMYSSSRGTIKIADTRQSALCESATKVLEEPAEDNATKTFFSEIIASISDVKFSSDGRYIASRDYLTIKIWDLNMETRPVQVININDQLRPILNDMYESDCIFDKFEVAYSPTADRILTGSYSNQFYIWSKEGRLIHNLELPGSGAGGSRPSTSSGSAKDGNGPSPKNRMKSQSGVDAVQVDKKVLHCAWNPCSDTVALASQGSLYLYKV